MVPTGLSAINSRLRKNDGRGEKKAKQLWRECSSPSWAMAACDKTAGLFWRMEFQQESPVQYMKAALRRQISQSSVLLLLLHLYTHPQKSPTAGQRSRTKRSTAICPVWTTAIYASAKWKGQSKSVQEDLGKEVHPPPLWKSNRSWSRNSPAEGSYWSQAVAGSERLCHRDLQPQVCPPTIWTGEFDQIMQEKGLAQKKNRAPHWENTWSRRKNSKNNKGKFFVSTSFAGEQKLFSLTANTCYRNVCDMM